METPLKDKGPEHIDFVVIRENTGGHLYRHGRRDAWWERRTKSPPRSWSIPGRSWTGACATPTSYTRKRNRKKTLTLVHKCNVLTYCGDLWVRAHKEMGDAEYKDIKQDYNHVDACNMWLVKSPEFYDVIVTENLFGDIITDLGAMIQGGMGIAAGGNINPEGVSMFEPIGGSAPKYTGKNVINPLAAICARRHDARNARRNRGRGSS